VLSRSCAGRGQLAVVDEALGQGDEGLMDIGTAVVTGAKAAEAVKPGQRPLRDPAIDAEAAAMVFVPPGQMGLDMTIAEFMPMGIAVIGTIGVEFVGSLSRAAGFSRHRRNRVDQAEQLGRVMSIGSGDFGRQRDTSGVGDHMMLCPGLTAIGGIRPCFFATSEASDRRTIDRRAREIHLVHPAKMIQQDLLHRFPDAGLLPIAQSSPTGHPRAAAHLLRQHLPGDARFEHEDNPRQGFSIRHRRASTPRGGHVAGQVWLDQFPKFVGKQWCSHDVTSCIGEIQTRKGSNPIQLQAAFQTGTNRPCHRQLIAMLLRFVRGSYFVRRHKCESPSSLIVLHCPLRLGLRYMRRRWLLGIRMHAAVFGSCCQVPVVVLPYAEKCFEWATRIGHPGQAVISVDGLGPGRLTDAVESF